MWNTGIFSQNPFESLHWTQAVDVSFVHMILFPLGHYALIFKGFKASSFIIMITLTVMYTYFTGVFFFKCKVECISPKTKRLITSSCYRRKITDFVSRQILACWLHHLWILWFISFYINRRAIYILLYK